MKSSSDIEKIDLDYILKNLKDEFIKLSKSKVLLTGCAGFLGYYIIKSIVNWNIINPLNPIYLFACDNFVRGKPLWLNNLKDKKIFIFEHNVINEFSVSEITNKYYQFLESSIN